LSGRARSGFTIVELTIVTVVATMLAVGLHGVYVRQQRLVRWQGQVAAVHDAYRVAVSLLASDVREAVPSDGDLTLAGSDVLSVRAPAGLAFVCDTRESPDVLALHHSMGLPVADGDSLLVYASDGWRSVLVVREERPGQRGMSCSNAPSTPQLQLRLASGQAEGVVVGSPVRAFRHHTYHLVDNAGEPWLGRTDAAGTEPLVGPLVAGGLRFRFLDETGTETAQLDRVGAVELRMVLPAPRSLTSGAMSRDTIETLFQVRNR